LCIEGVLLNLSNFHSSESANEWGAFSLIPLIRSADPLTISKGVYSDLWGYGAFKSDWITNNALKREA